MMTAAMTAARQVKTSGRSGLPEETSNRTALSEEEQEEESDDGRRQNERQGNHGVGDRAPRGGCGSADIVGQSNADEEGDDRRKTRDLKRDDERQRFVRHYFTLKPYFSKDFLRSVRLMVGTHEEILCFVHVLRILEDGGGADDRFMCTPREQRRRPLPYPRWRIGRVDNAAVRIARLDPREHLTDIRAVDGAL